MAGCTAAGVGALAVAGGHSQSRFAVVSWREALFDEGGRGRGGAAMLPRERKLFMFVLSEKKQFDFFFFLFPVIFGQTSNLKPS